MPVIVAEYLGVRTDTGIPIQPIKIRKGMGSEYKPTLPCPFKHSHCDKAKRGDKPICSVRDSNTNEVWIVCSHRLCATSPKRAPFTSHQVAILHQVAQHVYEPTIDREEILVKREAPVPVTEGTNYSADYVMWRKNPHQTSPYNPDRALVLEMQGGGETTNTGDLSRHIDVWDQSEEIDNNLLNTPVAKVAPLVTNAWRRQQEQFLVKGNVAMLTGGRMAFCVGPMIYDYLMKRFRDGILSDLRNANWTLAILTFIEDEDQSNAPDCAPNSIPLVIDQNKILFTNYHSFVQVLTNQAFASPDLFVGEYMDLSGETILVEN